MATVSCGFMNLGQLVTGTMPASEILKTNTNISWDMAALFCDFYFLFFSYPDLYLDSMSSICHKGVFYDSYRC